MSFDDDWQNSNGSGYDSYQTSWDSPSFDVTESKEPYSSLHASSGSVQLSTPLLFTSKDHDASGSSRDLPAYGSVVSQNAETYQSRDTVTVAESTASPGFPAEDHPQMEKPGNSVRFPDEKDQALAESTEAAQPVPRHDETSEIRTTMADDESGALDGFLASERSHDELESVFLTQPFANDETPRNLQATENDERTPKQEGATDTVDDPFAALVWCCSCCNLIGCFW